MRRRDADADVDLATLGAPGCLCSDFTGTGSHQRTTFSLSQIPGRAVGEGGEVGASCADTHAQMHCVWYSGNSAGRNFLQSMSTLSTISTILFETTNNVCCFEFHWLVLNIKNIFKTLRFLSVLKIITLQQRQTERM